MVNRNADLGDDQRCGRGGVRQRRGWRVRVRIRVMVRVRVRVRVRVID